MRPIGSRKVDPLFGTMAESAIEELAWGMVKTAVDRISRTRNIVYNNDCASSTRGGRSKRVYATQFATEPETPFGATKLVYDIAMSGKPSAHQSDGMRDQSVGYYVYVLAIDYGCVGHTKPFQAFARKEDAIGIMAQTPQGPK